MQIILSNPLLWRHKRDCLLSYLLLQSTHASNYYWQFKTTSDSGTYTFTYKITFISHFSKKLSQCYRFTSCNKILENWIQKLKFKKSIKKKFSVMFLWPVVVLCIGSILNEWISFFARMPHEKYSNSAEQLNKKHQGTRQEMALSRIQ